MRSVSIGFAPQIRSLSQALGVPESGHYGCAALVFALDDGNGSCPFLPLAHIMAATVDLAAWLSPHENASASGTSMALCQFDAINPSDAERLSDALPVGYRPPLSSG